MRNTILRNLTKVISRVIHVYTVPTVKNGKFEVDNPRHYKIGNVRIAERVAQNALLRDWGKGKRNVIFVKIGPERAIAELLGSLHHVPVQGTKPTRRRVIWELRRLNKITKYS